MKYRVCDKCGEIVARTGFISSSAVSQENGYFAVCNNAECKRRFSRAKYEQLKEKEF